MTITYNDKLSTISKLIGCFKNFHCNYIVTLCTYCLNMLCRLVSFLPFSNTKWSFFRKCFDFIARKTVNLNVHVLLHYFLFAKSLQNLYSNLISYKTVIRLEQSLTYVFLFCIVEIAHITVNVQDDSVVYGFIRFKAWSI